MRSPGRGSIACQRASETLTMNLRQWPLTSEGAHRSQEHGSRRPQSVTMANYWTTNNLNEGINMMLRKLQLVSVPVVTFIVGCGAFSPPLDVVESVDLTQYAGKWYEIARYPTFFQAACVSSTADYAARTDGTIGVLNTCLAADGSLVSTIEGSARVVDPTTNAKLVVTFPGVPFPGDYWIIDLGPNYEYAVVSDPLRLTLFILSRTPTLDQATLDGILSRLVGQGYDPARLVYDTPVAVP